MRLSRDCQYSYRKTYLLVCTNTTEEEDFNEASKTIEKCEWYKFYLETKYPGSCHTAYQVAEAHF